MYEIIIFTHSSLAESLVRVSWLILGNQPDTEAYCVEPRYSLEEMRDGVEQSVRRPSDLGQEVLVPTDLMYGAPFSAMIQLEEEYSFIHITGTNLPLLIEAINRRLLGGNNRSFTGLVDMAKEGTIGSHALLQMS